MANVFDQFDAPEQVNIFDQFDSVQDADAYLSASGAPALAATLEPSKEEVEAETARRLKSLNRDAALSAFGMGAPLTKEDVAKSADFLAGNLRQTELTERLPELQKSGLLSGESAAKVSAIAPVLLATTDPNEIAKIITSNFENVGLTYNKDAQGSVFPILVNNETGAATVINKPGLSGFDVMQGLGLAAAYTPAGRSATLAGAGLKSAATETAIQSGQKLAGGDFNPEQIAMSAGLGSLAKGVELGGKNILRMSSGVPENELVRAGERSGIRVLTSDVMPPTTFAGKQLQQTGEKIPFIGTGPIRAEQQAMRESAVNRVADNYSEYSYKNIIDSLEKTKDRLKSAAGSVLNKTGQKLDAVGDMPIKNTKAAIASAREELSKRGVIRDQSAINDLDALISTIDEVPQTFTTMKENRTAFREIINSFDPTTKSQLGSRAKGLLTSVGSAMSADMRKMAKRNLTVYEFNKWNKANSVYQSEAQKLTKTKLKNILDSGEVTPEKVKGMLFSKNPSETKILYDSLDQSGKSNARSALISKVVDDLSNGRAGGLTPNSFETSLRKLTPQINVFFKGEEKKQLMGLMEVLKSTTRAQDASVTTPTGQALAGALFGLSLATNKTATLTAAGTIAGLTRLYESPIVRNALLRLNSVPRGSVQYKQALSEAQEALTTAAQSLRDRESETE